MIVSTKDSVVISMTELEYSILVNATKRAHEAASNDRKKCAGGGYSTAYMYEVYQAQATQFWEIHQALQRAKK